MFDALLQSARCSASAVAPAFLLFWSVGASADLVMGRVVSVTDGDTITVLDAEHRQHKIRLAGIDAPERRQPYGTASRQALAKAVFNKDVEVETTKRDRYGRQVGKVMANGHDACLAQIAAGFAWHYKAYEREQVEADRRSYADAEQSARSARRGLWADADPVPPWDWRSHKWGDAF